MGRPAYRALLHDALADAAESAPEKVAVHVGDESLTYAELAAQSDRLAAALQHEQQKVTVLQHLQRAAR